MSAEPRRWTPTTRSTIAIYFDGEIEVEEEEGVGPVEMTIYLSGSKTDRQAIVDRLVTVYGNMNEAQNEDPPPPPDPPAPPSNSSDILGGKR